MSTKQFLLVVFKKEWLLVVNHLLSSLSLCPNFRCVGEWVAVRKGPTTHFGVLKVQALMIPMLMMWALLEDHHDNITWPLLLMSKKTSLLVSHVSVPVFLGGTKFTPSFVGSDYFCESGCPGNWDLTTFHADDPLWDGEGCGALEQECCAAPAPPWFHKVLDVPNTDDIEMRVCLEENTSHENVLISSYEICVLWMCLCIFHVDVTLQNWHKTWLYV